MFTWNLSNVNINTCLISKHTKPNKKVSNHKYLNIWSKGTYQQRRNHYYHNQEQNWSFTKFWWKVAENITTEDPTNEEWSLSISFPILFLTVKLELFCDWFLIRIEPLPLIFSIYCSIICLSASTNILARRPTISYWFPTLKLYVSKKNSHRVYYVWKRNPLHNKDPGYSFLERTVVSHIFKRFFQINVWICHIINEESRFLILFGRIYWLFSFCFKLDNEYDTMNSCILFANALINKLFLCSSFGYWIRL